jgi:hypothetical protein
MKTKLHYILILLLTFILSGCYTVLLTSEYSDSDNYDEYEEETPLLIEDPNPRPRPIQPPVVIPAPDPPIAVIINPALTPTPDSKTKIREKKVRPSYGYSNGTRNKGDRNVKTGRRK